MGAVTLSGTVDSDADRAEAVRIARATEGVSTVNDNLRVRPEGVATTGTTKETTGRSAADAIDDSWITTKIQSKYFLDDDVRGRNIDVDTRNGMVTLKGSVESEGERQQALSIARSTDGVTMVHDNLSVDRGAGNSLGGAGTRQRDNPVDDAWITMKVQSKYFIHDEIKSRTGRRRYEARHRHVERLGAVSRREARRRSDRARHGGRVESGEQPEDRGEQLT